MLHQFRGLDGQGHRDIFRRVELLPVTLANEFGDGLTNGCQGCFLVGCHHVDGNDFPAELIRPAAAGTG